MHQIREEHTAPERQGTEKTDFGNTKETIRERTDSGLSKFLYYQSYAGRHFCSETGRSGFRETMGYARTGAGHGA